MESYGNSLTRLAITTAWLTLSGPALAGGFALVTSDADSGPGTLRDALETQEATRIKIPGRIGDILINSTLLYSAEEPLTIIGSGQTIYTEANTTLIEISNGADLTIRNLHFEGPGGFSISNRGDLDGQGQEIDAGKGIFVDVRDDQSGMVSVNLTNVSVKGVANHGIHVSDCSLADDCGGGSGGGGEGSDASIQIICTHCRVDDAGNGKFDADGIRIDERGQGSIYALLKSSAFNNVGADGVEVDEGNDGGVYIVAVNTDFSDNGGYCDPDILAPFVPDDAEYADGEVEEDAVLIPSGSPDDTCIETEISLYDSGFVEEVEYGLDLDDGIDGDEAGAGSLWVSMVNSTIDRNLDEGVDMDEADSGDIVASYIGTHASMNNDDGFKMTEEDDGGMYGTVRGSSATLNGGKGFVFEEEDAGDLQVSVRGTKTAGNDDSDDTGIEAVQEVPGVGSLDVRGSKISDGIDLDGVTRR
ncbi:MAG: hypothetical protein V2I25_08470 [Woeseiaceae bacterium]|jgi:hypothetical protein|nr:hypothetical protein [Woeseiaceae bacterium]